MALRLKFSIMENIEVHVMSVAIDMCSSMALSLVNGNRYVQ